MQTVLLEQGENATPVVKDFLGTVAANIQVVSNFGDAPFLNEIAQISSSRQVSEPGIPIAGRV